MTRKLLCCYYLALKREDKVNRTESTRYSRLCSTKDKYDFLINLFTIRLTALDYRMRIIKLTLLHGILYHFRHQNN
jgi:hypothetical protein